MCKFGVLLLMTSNVLGHCFALVFSGTRSQVLVPFLWSRERLQYTLGSVFLCFMLDDANVPAMKK